MAGGIFNGGYNSLTQKPDAVLLPTMVRLSSDLLSYWTSMTCLYDPFWVPEADRATLPIAMMHITGIQEISSSQVNKNRVILYEPQVTNTVAEQANQVRPSIVRTVVDNIVREPKQYTINAVLPYQPMGRYVTTGVNMMSDTIAVFASIVGFATDTAMRIYQATSIAAYMAKYANVLATTLSALPAINNTTYINKQSLDAMWERSHILCMKMWTGYDYKYVAITNMDVEKKGTEDDVFRASIQVQEMPVLTINAMTATTVGGGGKLTLQSATAVAERALSAPLTAWMMAGSSSISSLNI